MGAFICSDQVKVICKWGCANFCTIKVRASKIGLNPPRNMTGDKGSPWNTPFLKLNGCDDQSGVMTVPSYLP